MLDLNMMLLLFSLLACTLLMPQAATDRILLVPMLYGSHVVENLHLGEALVQHGHDVHLALPRISKYNAMASKSRVKPLNFDTPDDIILLESKPVTDAVYNTTFRGYSVWQLMEVVTAANNGHCRALMHDKVFLETVRQTRFDVMIVGGVSATWCLFMLPHHMGVRHISMATFNSPWNNGVPALPSFNKSPLIPDEPPFSILQKLGNLAWLYYSTLDSSVVMADTELLQEFEPQMTSWAPLFRKSLLFLVYRDYMLDGAEPSMPNIIQTPALSYGEAKPLDLSLTAKMTSPQTILVSFGSAADTMPSDVAQKFIDAFAQFKDYNIFWRLKNKDNLKLPDNVHLLNWLPQNDLLGHNSTRLFIGHCGAGGVYEAMYHAVPIICAPMFADQEYNAVLISRRHYGLAVNLKSFTASELVQTMHDAMSSNPIRQAITRASAVLHDRQAPTEEMVYWIEHVMKYGSEHLRPVTMDMPLYEFLCLDIIAVVLLLAVSLVCITLCVATVVYRRCCKHKRPSKTKSE